MMVVKETTQRLGTACKCVRLLLKALLRFAFILINNCVAVPSYCLCLLLLRPLRLWNSTAYWRAEGAMYRWLQAIMSSWGWSAGYTVTEWGDDVGALCEDGAMVTVNHQATGDVCALLTALLDKGPAVRRMMWVMDSVFRYTHFGVVSWLHGDFFIRQGRAHRGGQLTGLAEHLRRHYGACGRRWIVLFPEGGFLRKRRASSQQYARRNSFPHLSHVTLPRLGAAQVILKTLGAGGGGDGARTLERPVGDGGDRERAGPLRWVVDVTIAYPKARPMDIQTWVLGYRPATAIHVHYRTYPVQEVPVDTEPLTDWLYQRFVEKDRLLAHFYATGAFPPAQGQEGEAASGRPVTLDTTWLCGVHLLALASGGVWYVALRLLWGCLVAALQGGA